MMCIILGCEYISTIKGLGTKMFFKSYQKFRNCEKIITDL